MLPTCMEPQTFKACNKFLQQNNSAEAHLEIKNVKERCMFMLEEAFSQVTCRLPSARDTFESS
jgi:hypothetical protein